MTEIDSHSYWLEATDGDDGARGGMVGDESCQVAVLGGGMVGLTCAYLLARDGVDVVLVEALQVGAGTTGHTTAKVTAAHGLRYHELVRRHGAETAAAYARFNLRGLALIDEVRAAESIACDWRRRDAYAYACDDQGAEEVTAEADAARSAGLECRLVTSTPLPFTVTAAVRTPDQAEFHPVKWLRGIARATEHHGARIFEHARAMRLSSGSRQVVSCEGGSLIADHVIVATHYPIFDRGMFFARLSAQRSYCLGIRARGPLPEGMFLSAGSPTRSLRTHPLEGGEELLIVGGEGHKSGQDDDTPARYEALERWAREHFDVAEVGYRWSAQDPMSPDLLPYIGPLTPRSDHVLVATGFGKWGMTAGAAAAAALSGRVLGRDDRDDRDAAIFDSNRFDLLPSAGKLLKENANVARRLIGDRLERPTSIDKLSEGSGAIVREDGRRVAAFRDRDGQLHMHSATCTHLGCEVRFNEAEESWDCPCHGSRFDARDGSVLEGPAVRALTPAERDTAKVDAEE